MLSCSWFYQKNTTIQDPHKEPVLPVELLLVLEDPFELDEPEDPVCIPDDEDCWVDVEMPEDVLTGAAEGLLKYI